MNSTLGFDKIYVINLSHRKDRRDELLEKFKDLDLTFVDAVNGNDLNIKDLIDEKILNKSFYDPGGILTKNIIGCALSHKKCWDKAIEDNVDTALILEDDVYMVDSVFEDYNEIFKEYKSYKVDLVNLGKKESSKRGINIGDHFTWTRFRSNFNGAHAYACTKDFFKILSDNLLPIKHAADVYIEKFIHTHNIFTLRKSLFIQKTDGFDPNRSDSDTFYNYFKENKKPFIDCNEDGLSFSKKVAKYIKFPIDVTDHYIELKLTNEPYGDKLFKQNNNCNDKMFEMFDFLKYLKDNNIGGNMFEYNCYTGERTFLFRSTNLFKNIFTYNNFEYETELDEKEIGIGFSSNNHIFSDKLFKIDSFEQLHKIDFVFFNNSFNEDINEVIQKIKSNLNKECYIAGDVKEDLEKIKGNNKKVFKNLWICKIEV